MGVALHDVPEDWAAADLDHGLRPELRFFSQAVPCPPQRMTTFMVRLAQVREWSRIAQFDATATEAPVKPDKLWTNWPPATREFASFTTSVIWDLAALTNAAREGRRVRAATCSSPYTSALAKSHPFVLG